ncbi:unnamed protein product, partial [Allacma fusca]
CKQLTTRPYLGSSFGILRESVFAKLDYFDVILDFPPCVMHSVYLGVARLFLKYWLSPHTKVKYSFSGDDIKKIDEFLTSIKPPSRVSRCPRPLKIAYRYVRDMVVSFKDKIVSQSNPVIQPDAASLNRHPVNFDNLNADLRSIVLNFLPVNSSVQVFSTFMNVEGRRSDDCVFAVVNRFGLSSWESVDYISKGSSVGMCVMPISHLKDVVLKMVINNETYFAIFLNSVENWAE